MRLWSIHPHQLDRAALVACWREALLAQAVIAGRTRGYTNHPQLERFQAAADPARAVGSYLVGLAQEADARGYRFNRALIGCPGEPSGELSVTSGQLAFEWEHLGAKLAARSPADAERWIKSDAEPHPLFVVVPGDVESWERAGNRD